MPIRINLLAEQQAAEELRRRDPVKRATWAAGFVVAVLLVWSGYLQFRLMAAMREVNRYEADWKKIEPDYKKVSENLEKLAEAERRWAALQALATNRFLWAPPLNALQYVMLNVDGVQVTRLKTDQTYTITEAVKPSTNANTLIVTRGKPGTSREKVVMTIDAKDSSKRPGDQVFKFQDAINSFPYFKTNLQKVELTGRSPQQEGLPEGRPFVTFTIECQFPEKVR
jgi:hypothetical protein